MQKHDNAKILLSVRLDNASWRDFLGGFLDAIRVYPSWRLRIGDPAELERTLDDESFDGLIVGDIAEQAAAHLTHLALPTVVVGSQLTSVCARRRNIVFLHNDDEDIGREGARIVQSLGLRGSFGFVPHPDATHWSALRAKGFAAELKAHGKSVSVFRPPASRESRDFNTRLLRWLKALPKPAAVMAAYDAIAVRILELCANGGIDVPSQLAVLGVDNDRLLCESARPCLSSIAPDHAHEGALAADALAQLLARNTTRPKTILCTRKALVARESTQSAKPATILMRRALDFIRERAATRLTPDDVARHLGVSRSLVELRFREFGERSLAATIRDVRLLEVRRQLRTTKQTIRTIADSCGWPNPNHLENAFKRRFGVSMRSIRAEP